MVGPWESGRQHDRAKKAQGAEAKVNNRVAKDRAKTIADHSEQRLNSGRNVAGKMAKKPVADHRDPPPEGGRHVAREAQAAEAKVSPAAHEQRGVGCRCCGVGAVLCG